MNIGRAGPNISKVGAGSFAIAAASVFDFRANAGQVSDITLVVKTGTTPTVGMAISLWDGTTTFQLVITAATTGATVGFGVTGNASFGGKIVNADPAVAGTAMYSGFNWTI